MLDVGKGGFRAHRPQGRAGDRPPGSKTCSGSSWVDEGDGGETADTDGDGPPTRSRRRSSGACARWASGSHVNAEGDLPAEAVADVFPAYDDDGGLLLVLTPK